LYGFLVNEWYIYKKTESKRLSPICSPYYGFCSGIGISVACKICRKRKKGAVRPNQGVRRLNGFQYSGAEAANTGKSNEGLVTITLPILYTRDWGLSTPKYKL